MSVQRGQGEGVAVPDEDGFEQVLAALRAGRAVIFPTDTVYGIGVAVEHAASPREVWELKRRDAAKPIAWLVDGPEALDRYGRDVPQHVRDLAKRQWPGALTIIVHASGAVPPAFAPTGTIGLRMPASDIALDLIRAAGPLATSSANRAGEKAPRTFEELDPSLVRAAAATLRADVPATGIASTVLDATTTPPRILRP